jgi:hypothetical protein
MGYVLKKKLKGLKNSSKAWHKEEYGGMSHILKGWLRK